jgi:hypothetical protein
MGVTTTAYSVPPKMMRKIRADNEKLAFVFGYFEDEDGVFSASDDEKKRWEVENCDFDSSIDVYIKIFRTAGYEKTARKIDSEYADLDTFEYGGYDIWVVPPSGVKAITRELEDATFEVLKAKTIGGEITDRRGNLLNQDLLESYLSDIESFKNFFNKAFAQGHYLIFAEA